MSESTLPRGRRRLPPLLTLAAAVALASQAVPAQAPPAARVSAAQVAAYADSVEAIRARAAEARRQLDSAESRALETPDDSLTLSGATVLLVSVDVPPRERDRLAAAFARVEDQLQRQLGDAGPALLAQTRWRIQVYRRPGVLASPAVVFIEENRRGQAGAPVLNFPLDVSYAAELVRRGVGEALVRRHPTLDRWLGGTYALEQNARTYYFANRDLVLHGNERSRSCARGLLDDCGRILDPARYGEWWTAGERRGSAATSHTVRASVLQYAIERSGGALLAALAAAPDSTTPIALIAAAVGESPDAFLAGWQQTVTAGGRVRSRVAQRMFVTSAAWILLFGFVATRRRPR
ncbi:MAG TPA: hypothetical protein PK788_01910 [Gemmatimonadaceae bacterium]|nr:hypothetical protein [Gemmatimonadaceae bacterium]